MFAVLVTGRLVQTDFQQMSETQFLINIPDALSINHLAVFMTGQTPFPDGMGGAVYFSMPGTETSWTLLGHITNTKPSAIFKISNLKLALAADGDAGHPFGPVQVSQPANVAQIGISVEPFDQLAQQVPATKTTVSTLDYFTEFSQKMMKNFVDYVSSFMITQSQMTPNPTENYVPLSTLQHWYQNYERKLHHNPNFWKS